MQMVGSTSLLDCLKLRALLASVTSLGLYLQVVHNTIGRYETTSLLTAIEC